MASPLGTFDLGEDYLRPRQLNSGFHNYRWILALDIIFAFLAAYGIGANDVANAFGTSVGSKTLTMRQAVLIASVFEWTGAFFLGAQVTRTIAGGIAKGYKFVRSPELFMFGMMCADLGVAIWLLVATYLELPVSTTHSIVGAVIGMTLVLKGGSAVYWHTRLVPRKFPYIGGVSMIVISWFTSPLLSAIAAAIIFLLVRTLCLRAKNAFQRTFFVIPIVVALAVAINLMFLVEKGAQNQGGQDLSTETVQAAAWGSGAFAGLVVACLMPFLRKKILRAREAREQAAIEAKSDTPEVAVDTGNDDAKVATKGSDFDEPTASPESSTFFGRFLGRTVDRDIHKEGMQHQARFNSKLFQIVKDIHANAETFDPDAENAFKYLQVLSACCNSLSHGANDVANAIGPLAAVHQVYNTGSFSSRAPVERWVLVVGATGIVIGLATYGYNIMRALGVKLTRITPSRGFSMELGASLVVLVATNYGLPVSTTHCIVGATIGVGALEGRGGVNWLLFLKFVTGWVVTLVAAGGITAAIVAIGAYAPSVQMADQIEAYENEVRIRSQALIWGSQWQAQANALSAPGTVLPPNLTSAGYLPPVVPEIADFDPTTDVPNDRFWNEWRKELFEDQPLWSRSTSIHRAWSQAFGFEAPGWDGANVSTVDVRPSVFGLFDRYLDIAFSANQAVLLKQIASGEKRLCCDESYKCCARECDYKKVDDACEGRCEMVKEDESCVEEGCDEPKTWSSFSSAKTCTLVDTDDDCPVMMAADSSKNYVGPNYVNRPQANSTLYVPSEAVEWREDDIDLSLQLCPVKLT